MLIENKPGCIEAAARILGDKWTPLLIKALALRSLRFCELQKAAGGINPRTLSARLSALEQHGIIAKQHASVHSAYAHYVLTTKGNDLIPILRSMALWGERYSSTALSMPIVASTNPPIVQDAALRS